MCKCSRYKHYYKYLSIGLIMQFHFVGLDKLPVDIIDCGNKVFTLMQLMNLQVPPW